MRRQNWLWYAVAALAVLVLVAWLLRRFPEGLDADGPRHLVYLVLLLALVGGSVVLHVRYRPVAALRHVAIWVGVGLVLVIGYSYRDVLTDLKARLAGELVPAQGQRVGENAVMFRAGEDGHFRVEALVEGRRLLFMVDTGASDTILSRADAERLGINPDSLSYTVPYSTANGVVYGAPVRLGEVVVGPIRLTDVRASVNQAPMAGSLLGMSFLGRLGGYEVRNGKLTLWQ